MVELVLAAATLPLGSHRIFPDACLTAVEARIHSIRASAVPAGDFGLRRSCIGEDQGLQCRGKKKSA